MNLHLGEDLEEVGDPQCPGRVSSRKYSFLKGVACFS